MDEKLLRLRQVAELTGLKRTSIYNAIKSGEFPRPVFIGQRAVTWRATEVAKWIDSRRPAGASRRSPRGRA